MLQMKIVDFSHAEPVLQVTRTAFAAQALQLRITRESNPHHGAFETLDDLRERMNNGEQPVLAYLDQRLVGSVRFRIASHDPLEGHISRLAVLPEFRGRQFGVELMQFAEKQLRKRGATRSLLGIVEVFDRLRVFYESLGYAEVERRQREHLPFGVIIMRKDLGKKR